MINTPSRLALTAAAGAVLALLAACSSAPETNPALESARSRLNTAQATPQVATLAAPELNRAREALRAADQARSDGAPLATIDHLAYLTRQRVVIAEDTATSRAAQAVTAGAAAERDRMRLALRTQEADAAQRKLSTAELTNQRTTAELANAEQASARKSAELAQADAAAQAERMRMAQSTARVNDLEAQLRDMNARKTDRGIVVTLGDLLFSTGQARLQPEGNRSMTKLAEFLQRNPDRRAAIEGYTDSVGTNAYNQDLSDRRAHAVMAALVQMGVSPDRLTTQAYGEDRPVADNNTASGRQMNRRVEVVFSPQAGDMLVK